MECAISTLAIVTAPLATLVALVMRVGQVHGVKMYTILLWLCTMYTSDILECVIDNGGCEHICTDFPGGYECSCRDGYHEIGGICEGILKTQLNYCDTSHYAELVIPGFYCCYMPFCVIHLLCAMHK